MATSTQMVATNAVVARVRSHAADVSPSTRLRLTFSRSIAPPQFTDPVFLSY